MKFNRPVLAASILAALGLFLVLTTDRGEEGGTDSETTPTAAATGGGTDSSPLPDRKHSRTDRSKEPSESPDAKTLKLLWARGRGQELLVALDQLSARADTDDWRQVADVLVEQAANDGRHEIATYLLATGHGAPDKIRLSIYAAAMENPDEGIRSSAKLELLNLTGREFVSRQEADAWIATLPADVDDRLDSEE
jgi:hypothetical protein